MITGRKSGKDEGNPEGQGIGKFFENLSYYCVIGEAHLSREFLVEIYCE